jgi:hypothetical protein
MSQGTVATSPANREEPVGFGIAASPRNRNAASGTDRARANGESRLIRENLPVGVPRGIPGPGYRA